MTNHNRPSSSTGGRTVSWSTVPTRTISVGGTDFAYRTYGPADGVPVVFLNHLAANLDNWDPRVTDGIASRHRVIAFDNRGVGASGGTTPDSIEAMAADAIAFIDAMGVRSGSRCGRRLPAGRFHRCPLRLRPGHRRPRWRQPPENADRAQTRRTGPRGGGPPDAGFVTQLGAPTPIKLVLTLLSRKCARPRRSMGSTTPSSSCGPTARNCATWPASTTRDIYDR